MTITLEDSTGRVLATITPGKGQRVRLRYETEVAFAADATPTLSRILLGFRDTHHLPECRCKEGYLCP